MSDSYVYCTTTQVTNLLNPILGSSDSILTDTYIDNAIALAKNYIDNATFRDFSEHTDDIEWHDGNGRDSINTYNYPILSLSYVIMYNQLMQAMRTFLDTELIIHPEWGEIFLPPIYPVFLSDKPFSAMFGNVFISGRRNIEIKYSWGYETPPDDIQYACTLMTGTYLLQQKGGYISAGVTSRSIDGYSESYGKMPFEGLLEQWQKQVDAIIMKHRRLTPRAI